MTTNTESRSAPLSEAFSVCAGLVILSMLWAFAAGVWLPFPGVPALPVTLAAGALFAAVHLRTPAQRERVRMRRLPLPAWAIAGAVGSFMVLKHSVDTLLLSAMPQHGRDPVSEWVRSGGGWMPVVAGLVLLVPLVEETFFRGMMQTWLERRYGATAALLATAVIFALGHFSLKALPSVLIAGLVFGYAFRASGSIWMPVLLHVAANATVALSTAGLPFGVRAAWALLLPSAVALAWFGRRLQTAGPGTELPSATEQPDLALVS